ncbi:MAG: hypothetical protein ACI4DX_00165 [Oliverpabstia sp.]
MKAQQASAAINNANIDLTIRKPRDFKPRKGYKLVHLKYSRDLEPTADSTHRILGRGYFWTEKGIKELCYVIEVPVNEAEPLNRMFENEKAEYRRAHRCKIWNKKRTKKIMCPFTNTCSKCPYAEHLEEIFPSEAEEHQELSFDEVNEDKLFVAPDSFGSAEYTEHNIQMEEMMAKLKSLEDNTLYIIGTLLNQEHEIKVIQDRLKDIQNQLHIDDERMEAYATEYITYYRSYID